MKVSREQWVRVLWLVAILVVVAAFLRAPTEFFFSLRWLAGLLVLSITAYYADRVRGEDTWFWRPIVAQTSKAVRVSSDIMAAGFLVYMVYMCFK